MSHRDFHHGSIQNPKIYTNPDSQNVFFTVGTIPLFVIKAIELFYKPSYNFANSFFG